MRETLQAQQKRRRRHARESELGDDHEHAATTRADFGDAIGLADAARAALDRLGDRERAAMVLHYVHDLSDSQIAKALGCRRGTVNSLLSRARSKLRAMPELDGLATAPRKEDL